MRLLACFVALLTLVTVLALLALAGPHSDVPGQPTTSLVAALLALGGGGALARALWRRGPGAAWGLPLWAASLAVVVLGLAYYIASPAERVEARPALLLGLTTWALATVGLTRYVRRRVTAAV